MMMLASRALFILAAFSLSAALQKQDLELHFDKNLLHTLILKHEKAINSGKKAGGITLVVNGFIDKLLESIRRHAQVNHLDPLPLDNITETLLQADIMLSCGVLRGISSLIRHDDVKLSFSKQLRKLEVRVPIKFDNLTFTYDYLFKFMKLGPKGDLIGEIENFKFNLHTSLNFATLNGAVEELNTMDNGHISLIFHGNVLSDAIFNIVSEFFSTVFHPLVQKIIEGVITNVSRQIIQGVNEAITEFIRQSESTISLEDPVFVHRDPIYFQHQQ